MGWRAEPEGRYGAVAHDFQFERDQSFGEWLHHEFHEAVSFEDAKWAIDRVHRVEERLQTGRAPSDRLVVEIPWLLLDIKE